MLYLDHVIYPQGGTGVTFHPLFELVALSCALSGHSNLLVGALLRIPVPDLDVYPGMYMGLGRVKVLLGLGIPRWAYMHMLIPAPPSHCRLYTLILCAITLDPRMHRYVAHTKVMAILIWMYPHFQEYVCCQFFERWLDNLFGLAVEFTPSSSLTKATKGYNFLHCWRHASK